ncbi:MAG: M14 family zinc carboxypeptidase [Candidatus Paceibacterota bacterium]
MKQFLVIVVILLIALGAFGWYQGWFSGGEVRVAPNGDDPSNGNDDTDTGTTTDSGDTAGEGIDSDGTVIGSSAGGRDIVAYRYGRGGNDYIIVAGIHGGYSANTSLTAFELMDWLEANPDEIPDDVQVTVIPVLNPDGLNEVMGTTDRFSASAIPAREERIAGRFNANGVDLNRNFDCDWQSTGTWQSREVDGGSRAFSEPESVVLRNYVRTYNPTAAVVFYSAAGEVVAASCGGTTPSGTQALVNAYASASGYTPKDSFDHYEITGDAANWMAKEGIPTISVILNSHTSAEWTQNRAGIRALLERH